ncbi:FadR/GntR family transcriptional regulator [Pacificibacter marinus]|uniref:Pyruvate dehydrogenase complex repressor n=1 Tax=Pacificibacter marinus TaxID=658057 RepID=A0A1Y5S923_9RHOB|nr:FadR/GntR family transcriptional regulator [Pacificibacter marinus]SEK78131.1 DNA-binding transcriptional regulator, FadR family [Pacificibacter marinus]SLN33831.1 Pyruvate dehydrogenase complex repressor [Pacificibacter marinus]
MSILKSTISGTPRRNNHAHVVNEIGHAIVNHTFATGEILPKDVELEQRFNVSRTVLREAMKTLSAKGMVFARARVGTRVTDPSEWNFFDKDVLEWHLDSGFDRTFIIHLTDIRLSLEPFAARLAAQRISPNDLDTLQKYCNDMELAPSNEAFALADLNFHQVLLQASGNPFMLSIGNIIEAALANTFQISGPTNNQMHHLKAVAAHRDITRAIANADADAAAAAMHTVILAGRDRVLKAIDQKSIL